MTAAYDRKFDVVIAGGGVIGSSIAYWLTANPDFRGSVAVIERDPLYTVASSSLSTSSIRQQFGTPPNILMSRFGIEFMRQVGELLTLEGEQPVSIGLREPGYLILGGPAQRDVFQAKAAAQRACGVQTELMDVAALGERFSWLNTEGLAVGSLGLADEGWFDGPGLLQAFRRKARAQGATYIAAEVTAVATDGHRVTEVGLSTAERLACGTLVNAAGAWAGRIARMLGVDLPVVPRRRCVFVVDCPDARSDAPFVFDPSGVWARPEGAVFLCGAPPRAENADDDFGMEVDHELFEDRVWPALAHRIPAFERLRLLRSWAGLYEYNTFDHSAIIGRCPEWSNVVFVNGFSGHGMMHSPAAGRGASELITYGEYRSMDLAPFGFERIEAGERIAEHVY